MTRLQVKRFGFALIVAGGLLVGCASTKMESVDRSDDFLSSRIHKVLVVGALSRPEVRKAFESACVRRLKSRHVEAVADMEVLGPDTPLSYPGVSAFAKEQGFDTVIVTNLKSRGGADHQGADVNEANPDMTSETALVASPEYDANYEVVVLKTVVYSVATGDKLWTGTTDTLITGPLVNYIDSMVKILVNKLYEN